MKNLESSLIEKMKNSAENCDHKVISSVKYIFTFVKIQVNVKLKLL